MRVFPWLAEFPMNRDRLFGMALGLPSLRQVEDIHLAYDVRGSGKLTPIIDKETPTT
jgi:hypothetical protein